LTPVQASELDQNPVVSSAAVGNYEFLPIAIQVQGLNVNRPVPLDLENVGGAVNTSLLSSCPPESCSHGKRDGQYLIQPTPLEELKMMSQARGARNLAALPGYVYDSRAGTGITVYVLDSGVDPNHPVSVTYQIITIRLRFTGLQEFDAHSGSIRWLYLPNEPHVETDTNGHGTCVASKVRGRAFGVAKNVNLVIVKAMPSSGITHASQLISAWAIVARDIETAGLNGRAVVTTSIGCEQTVFEYVSGNLN
jgi:subtilisin family serine protease